MEKHLEFIQNIITRHNSNSFMLKGWAVTIVVALLTIAGTLNQSAIMIIAIIPIFLFWGLDAFYLANERCFIDLFNAVAKGKFHLPEKVTLKVDFNKTLETNIDGKISDYNMNFKRFKIWKDNSWSVVTCSKSIFWFYFPLLILTLLVFISSFYFSLNDEIKVNTTINPTEFKIKLDSEPPTIINNIYPVIEKDDSVNIKK